MLYGAIEAGGTKFVCAVGDEKGNVLKRIQIPTTVPDETIPEVVRFFGIRALSDWNRFIRSGQY